MNSIFVYGQEYCPKCDALKNFLTELNITFTELDMADNRDYLDSWDAFPADAGAPVLEVRDPTNYEDNNFWMHDDLFKLGKLDTGLVETILGMKLVAEWE